MEITLIDQRRSRPRAGKTIDPIYYSADVVFQQVPDRNLIYLLKNRYSNTGLWDLEKFLRSTGILKGDYDNRRRINRIVAK